jgi:hypothetical protein
MSFMAFMVGKSTLEARQRDVEIAVGQAVDGAGHQGHRPRDAPPAIDRERGDAERRQPDQPQHVLAQRGGFALRRGLKRYYIFVS